MGPRNFRVGCIKKYMVGTTVGHGMRCNILGEDGDQPFIMDVLRCFKCECWEKI
jgi:hypothetical protein